MDFCSYLFGHQPQFSTNLNEENVNKENFEILDPPEVGMLGIYRDNKPANSGGDHTHFMPDVTKFNSFYVNNADGVPHSSLLMSFTALSIILGFYLSYKSYLAI